MTEFLAKIFEDLTIFAKSFIIDIWKGLKYVLNLLVMYALSLLQNHIIFELQQVL